MIVCTRCGFENEDTDTFCGSCAGFLEWEGQKVEEEEEEAPAPEPESEPEPDPQHQGFLDRVKEAIGKGDDRSDHPGDVAPEAGEGVVATTGELPVTGPESLARRGAGVGSARRGRPPAVRRTAGAGVAPHRRLPSRRGPHRRGPRRGGRHDRSNGGTRPTRGRQDAAATGRPATPAARRGRPATPAAKRGRAVASGPAGAAPTWGPDG